MDGNRNDPYLDAGMIGFIHNFARKNHWRVAAWLDLDDLVQEGWLSYYAIRRHPRYAALTNKRNPTPDDIRQVMALVRTTFTRRMHSLAKSFNAIPEASLDGSLSDLAPAADCANGIGIALAGMPHELANLLAMLVAGDLKYRRVRRGTSRPLRETTNEALCRLLGVDPRKVNVYRQILQHLG